jgi:hypothetical protein
MPGHFLACDFPGCSNGISSPDDKFGGRALQLGREAGWQIGESHEGNPLQRGPDYCPDHREAGPRTD